MMIDGRKYKKLKKKKGRDSIMLFCSVSYQTRPKYNFMHVSAKELPQSQEPKQQGVVCEHPLLYFIFNF
jgi:hypothetical protein